MIFPHSHALVFFEATGDLVYKKIFPALYAVERRGHLQDRDAVLRVTNGIKEDALIHWHGLFLPPGMDRMPGVRSPRRAGREQDDMWAIAHQSQRIAHEEKRSAWLLIGLQVSLRERWALDSEGTWQKKEPVRWKRSKAPLSISCSGCGSR